MKEIQILNNGESLHDIRTKINENFDTLNEAENINYNPFKTGLNADNVQDAIDVLQKQSLGLTRFCVNNGNYTNDEEDLFSYSDGTLSFKVGTTYPYLTATLGNGTSFRKESIEDVDLSDYENGTYKIYIGENENNYLSSTLFQQKDTPLAPNNGDIWFNGEETKKFETGSFSVSPINPTIPIAGSILSIAYGNNKYVIVTSLGNIYTTVDGTTVIQQSSGNTNFLRKVQYINNIFVTCGISGTLLTSPDGVTWTKRTVNTSLDITDVTYGNGVYVAVCSGGTALTSSNLTTWSPISQFGGKDLAGVAYGNNKFIALASSDNIYTSTNGNTWQVSALPLDVSYFSIRYINNTFIICAHAYVLKSTDGTNWTYLLNGTTPFRDVDYMYNRYIFVTNFGTAFIVNENFNVMEQLITNNTSVLTCCTNGIMGGVSGTLLRYQGNEDTWVYFDKAPTGEVTVTDSVITNVVTYPYDRNNLQLATTQTAGLLRTASLTDEQNCQCEDAAITPKALSQVENYRQVSTAYNVGDTCACQYHAEMLLRCTTAGTTSATALDTSETLVDQQEITDGTVVWTVEEITQSFNTADKDLSNLSTEGKALAAGFAMPSDESVNILWGTQSRYVAPANGWIYYGQVASAAGDFLTIVVTTGNNDYAVRTNAISVNIGMYILVPIKSGATAALSSTSVGQTVANKFIYAEGEI